MVSTPGKGTESTESAGGSQRMVNSPWTKQDGIRPVMTSRLTASLCVANRSEYARYASRFAPCQPGASPVSVLALLYPRTVRAEADASGPEATLDRPCA